jgi:hypothetical protein
VNQAGSTAGTPRQRPVGLDLNASVAGARRQVNGASAAVWRLMRIWFAASA